MRSRVAIAVFAFAASCLGAAAQTGSVKSPTMLNTEVNTLFPDQQNGLITPFNARQTLLDIIASNLNIAPANGLMIGSTPITGGVTGNCLYVNGSVLGNQTCGGGGGGGNLVIGTTTVGGGSVGSFLVVGGGGLLQNTAPTGTGSVVLSTSPVLTTPTLGNATANSINGLAITSTTNSTLTIPNNVTLSLPGGFNTTIMTTGVTSITLPTAGTLATTSQIPAFPLTPDNGGTGVANNAANTITISGGAFGLTLALTGTTSVTLPTSGTLVNSGVTTLSSLVSVGTLTGGATGAGFTVALGTSTLTGQTPLANGGTNANLTADNGAVPYSDGTKLTLLASTGTASQCLLSGNHAAPSWGSCSGAAAVSSVSNSDGTLTVSPTTGAVVASLALGHANHWTGVQTLDSPVLNTPNIGVATATTVNKVTITTPATGSTLTLTDGKTLAASNTITLAGTDSTTWTGASSNMTLAALNIADQTVTGGANVTSDNLGTVSSGTQTIDCGARPLQYLTNNGAFTLAAPSNDGSCIVLVTNGASAGTITFSGFSPNTIGGDTYATTNANVYSLFVWKINGKAGARWAANQ